MSLAQRLIETTVAIAAAPLFAPERGRRDAADAAHAFTAAAARSGAAEIALSEVALGRSTTPAVTEFARRMVAEHTALDEELRSLAAIRGMAPPAGPFDDVAADAELLRDLPAEAFDAAYLARMVDDHEAAVALFARQAADFQAPELAALAARSLPMLRDHLAQARSLRDTPPQGKAGKARRARKH
ncbi:MAG: DUF4142 domain-containing protein [Actinomycetota bacterium]